MHIGGSLGLKAVQGMSLINVEFCALVASNGCKFLMTEALDRKGMEHYLSVGHTAGVTMLPSA